VLAVALNLGNKALAYNLRDVGELLVGRNGNRLNEKFVSALCVKRGVFSHSLQQDWLWLVG
jgi:hypothetical protein